MPTLSNEPNNQWLDEIISNIRGDDYGPMNYGSLAEAKAAILSKLESIEQEAYKKGYIAGGIEILNTSCEVCNAYPMTADCNNANCHAIER